MYSSQQRAHISQPRRNPTIKRYTEDSRSFVDAPDMDIDLTKQTDLARDANAGANSSYLDEESSFDDYASEASGSSFSSTASLVDQLGGTYDEPELLVTTAPSTSPSPPTPIIPTKAPKPVGVFSIADFMKNVQAPPVQPATLAPPLQQADDPSLHKRSSAYSQSSKEPMTSIDPQDEENTWESGNNVNDFDVGDNDDSSSGFPPLDSSSDNNSVLSDPPEYDQNYDRSFEEEEGILKDQEQSEEDSPLRLDHRQQAVPPSPASSIPSAENAVFSQANPLFTRRTHNETAPRQQQATEVDRMDSHTTQSSDQNYQANSTNSANSSVRSQPSRPNRKHVAPPPPPAEVVSVVPSLHTSAPVPVPPPAPAQPFYEAETEEVQFVVDEPLPPPPLHINKDRYNPVSTASAYTSPLKSQLLPAQLQLEPEDVEVDINIDTVHNRQRSEPVATATTTAALEIPAIINNRARVATNFADEYATMGTYSHYFHTPLVETPSIPTPPIKALPLTPIVCDAQAQPSKITVQKESHVASVPSLLTPPVATPTNSNSIEEAELSHLPITPPAATTINHSYSSPIVSPNAKAIANTTATTVNPNSPSTADIALTTSSSRFRGRYLSPDKVRASLLTATATPAMSSPVPDSGRVDRFRNKKSFGASVSGILSEGMNASSDNNVNDAAETNNATVSVSPATGGKPSNNNNQEYLHNTTDTAGSLYSNIETQSSFSSSLRALNDAELLLQYKTSLLLQSQLIDKILQQRSSLLDSQDPEQQLRWQMTINITTEMLQKSVFESSILSSAVFSVQPSLNNTATYTQDSNVTYTQSSLGTNPATAATTRSVSRSGASSRMLSQSNETVPVPPPLKHYTYGPHAVTATTPRTSHSAVRGSVTAGTLSARSLTPTSTATTQGARKIRSNTPNMRTAQPMQTMREPSTPPTAPLPTASSEQVSIPGAARGDALRRTPTGVIISSPLSGSLKRANSVTKASTSRNTARTELDRVNNTYSSSGSKSFRNISTPANLVITPIKTDGDGIDLVASTMNSSIQLFASSPLSHDTFRRNASLVNSLLGNIDNYCNCCRTKLIDMDAQKNMKLKHSQCRKCLHSK